MGPLLYILKAWFIYTFGGGGSVPYKQSRLKFDGRRSMLAPSVKIKKRKPRGERCYYLSVSPCYYLPLNQKRSIGFSQHTREAISNPFTEN